MGVVDLRTERRRRRPVSNETKLMFAAETLWQFRHDNEGLLFLPTEDVMASIGPAFNAVMEVVIDLAEERRSS